MSTGYTAKLYDREQSFEDFLLTCARAFGACVEQRDDSMDEPPKLQKVSDYHSKEIICVQKELDNFKKNPKEKFRPEFEKYILDSRDDYEKHKKKNLELENRYKKMLEKVEEWKLPTENHKGLKDFMLQQLNDSILHDCGGNYYEKRQKELESLTFDEWYGDKKNRLSRDLEYHTEENKKEIERVNRNNKWISALYESLKKNKI